MKKIRLIVFILTFIDVGNIFSQELINVNNGCSFEGDNTDAEYYSFDPTKEADQIVKQILDASGSLSYNSFTIKESNVKNALAAVINGQRFILYSSTFLEKFKGDSKAKWSAYLVLGHEIGHHLNNHNFDEKDVKKRKIMELEADKFAGAVCRTLGATLEEALAGIESIKLPGETATHPPKSARIAAISNGWKKQDELLKANNIERTTVIDSTKGKKEDEEEKKSVSQRVKDLEIRFVSAKKSLNSIDVTLKFIAFSEKAGTGYALKASGSDGLADYWKFSPYAIGKLVDDLGNEYNINTITGMGYARNIDDWTLLKSREEAIANIEFSTKSSSAKIGSTFNLYLEIWVIYTNENRKSAKIAYTINFNGIKLNR